MRKKEHKGVISSVNTYFLGKNCPVFIGVSGASFAGYMPFLGEDASLLECIIIKGQQ